MNKVNFSVNEFPNLCKEFRNRNYKNWITFLYDLGYKFEWQHYATKKKFVEMDEDEFTMFVLRWA